MQIENEVKYKISGFSSIKNKLLAIGFKFSKKLSQEDYYFSPPHKNFAGTKKYYLRVRHDNKGESFEYHVVKSNIQTNETGVAIKDHKTIIKILKLLDFKLDCVVAKERLVYTRKHIEVSLDKIKNLGSFIEIEFCGKFNKEIKKEFAEIGDFLQVKETDKVIGVGYPDLLMQQNKKK